MPSSSAQFENVIEQRANYTVTLESTTIFIFCADQLKCILFFLFFFFFFPCSNVYRTTNCYGSTAPATEHEAKHYVRRRRGRAGHASEITTVTTAQRATMNLLENTAGGHRPPRSRGQRRTPSIGVLSMGVRSIHADVRSLLMTSRIAGSTCSRTLSSPSRRR